jgi:hypothetical protein
MKTEYHRNSQDIGNVIALDHVNVAMPDPAIAMVFYVSGLGLTRDPYFNVGSDNMWINIGEQQFHLPTRPVSQCLRGRITLVIPNISLLPSRLENIRDRLKGTQFDWEDSGDSVEVIGPWGNRFLCLPPSTRFNGMRIGIARIEFIVPIGSASGISRFYRDVFGAPSVIDTDSGMSCAIVTIGRGQTLCFTDNHMPLPSYDGHHIAINIANFSVPHQGLDVRGLVTEETSEHQYRFHDIVDPDSGEVLYQLEHEVRSLYHPMFGRSLVNRDPGVSSAGYLKGSETLHAG